MVIHYLQIIGNETLQVKIELKEYVAPYFWIFPIILMPHSTMLTEKTLGHNLTKGINYISA